MSRRLGNAWFATACCAVAFSASATDAEAANLEIQTIEIVNASGEPAVPKIGERFSVLTTWLYHDAVCTDYAIRREMEGQIIDAPPINWGCGYPGGTTGWVHVWSTFKFDTPGLKNLTVTIDVFDAIAETDEADNALTIQVPIGIHEYSLSEQLTWPIAGRLGVDTLACTFFDGGPVGVRRDFNCNNWAYGGHGGTDIGHGFEAMEVGPVAVFATQDGVVAYTADGYDDRRTDCDHPDPGCGNQITIDHGYGLTSIYCHLQKNSLLVDEGDSVVAGEQIATTGSSGCSTGPHVHFELQRDGLAFDPMRGDCNQTPWASFKDQPELKASVLAESYISLSCGGPRPLHHYYFYPSDVVVTINSKLGYLPQGGVLEWQFVQNGEIFGTKSYGPFGADYCDASWRWCIVRPSGTGEGSVRVLLNGELLWEQPYLAVAYDFVPPPNVPPTLPITRFAEPPHAGEVTWVHVSRRSFDADYDPIRYRYEWFIDDVPVREHTTMALTDALPATRETRCSALRCRVTPLDDEAAGPSREIRARVGLCAENLPRSPAEILP